MNPALKIGILLSAIAFANTPLTVQAQNSRPLTEEEQTFVNLLDEQMSVLHNPFTTLISNWGKADDGQMLCAALEMGETPRSITRKAVERSMQIENLTTRKHFEDYFNYTFVTAVTVLCPEYGNLLDKEYTD